MEFYVFDFSKRHCWAQKDGRYRIEGTLYGEDSFCNEWRNHPLGAGTSEFIRWIREFGILAPNIVTGFEDGWLKLGNDWCVTYNMDMYCENYGDKVKCFLDTDNGEAVVEIFDETLLDAAEQATILVNKQYEDMVK
jgi:hypothetical protein